MEKALIFSLIVAVLVIPALVRGQQEKPGISPLQNVLNWVRETALFFYGKVYSVLSQQVEERKPGVEQEFNKETEELKEGVLKEWPSWWERFKNLIWWTPNQ